jgi:hypothetical protein
MNSTDPWWSLLTGQLSEEEARHLLSRGVEELHALLEARPRAMEDVLDILDRRLGGEIDAQTWKVLDDSLAHYLGRDLAHLVAWAVQPDQTARLEELQRYASPEVMAFFRTILGRYGPEWESALLCWNELSHDWRTLHREVYYDQLNRQPYIRLRIEKYNGETVLIEGNADSILGLTSGLILTLRLVGIPEAFSESRIKQFREEVEEFKDLLFPGE